MFNHSKKQNVGYQRDFNGSCIVYTTLRDVTSGEELCISYGPRLWFDDAEAEEGDISDNEENALLDIARIDLHGEDSIAAQDSSRSGYTR